MNMNAKDCLDNLLKTLQEMNATTLAEEIKYVIARGTTEKLSSKGKSKEQSQRPLTPEEAYTIAIEMLIASLEPILMHKYASKELCDLVQTESEIVWHRDFVEESPINLEESPDTTLKYDNKTGESEKKLKYLIDMLKGGLDANT